MGLAPGDRLGPNRIEGALGAGGMSEVRAPEERWAAGSWRWASALRHDLGPAPRRGRSRLVAPNCPWTDPPRRR